MFFYISSYSLGVFEVKCNWDGLRIGQDKRGREWRGID
jgi:hypothetical protein